MIDLQSRRHLPINMVTAERSFDPNVCGNTTSCLQRGDMVVVDSLLLVALESKLCRHTGVLGLPTFPIMVLVDNSDDT
jgi:hypothetical protein